MSNNDTTKTRKNIYKKWWFWLIIVIIIFGIIGSSGNSDKDNKTIPESTNAENVDDQNDTTEAAGAKESTDNSYETTVEDSKSEESLEPKADPKEELKKAIKDKEHLVWFGDVRNDVTGNWRLSEYTSRDSQESFAADYYKAFFENDKEIHAVINMTLKTTSCLSVIDSNTIDVTIKEYIKGEEHDAKELFGGMLLKEYWVHLDTGDIEEIQ